jgi:hypothetical protein
MINEFDIKIQCRDNLNTLLLVPIINYDKIIVNVVKQLNSKKTCYITLNKTYDALIELLKTKNVNTDNFVFIDGITKTVRNISDVSNCRFIDPPIDLTDLSRNIYELLKNGFDYMIFDSLSNLFTYQKENAIEYFLQNLINILDERNCRGVFFALKDHRPYLPSPLIKLDKLSLSQDEKRSLLDGSYMFTSRMTEGMTIFDVDEEGNVEVYDGCR